MITFQQFKTRWLGKSVDWDHVYNRQCVDLILQGLYEMDGVTGTSGNAINYWTAASPALLKKYAKHDPETPREGDIAIFKTKGRTDYTGDGHIGWATGQFNSTQMEILEQNGQTGAGDGVGGNEIRLRWIDRSRLAGLLRRIPAPLPKPYYIVAAPDFTPKQVVTKREALKFNLAHQTEAEMLGNILERQPAGLQFYATALLHHTGSNKDYYLQDQNNPVGYLVSDCEDYVAPKPTPPAAPEKFKPADKYKLITIVKYYANYQDAIVDQSAKGTVSPKADGFYIWSEKGDIVNISTSNMSNDGYWINKRDNVVEAPKSVPEPTIPDREPVLEQITIPDHQPEKPVTPELHPLFEDGSSIRLVSMNSIQVPIKSLDGGFPEAIDLPAHKELEITHWFEHRGNVYFQDVDLHREQRFYALSENLFPDPDEVANALDKARQLAEQRVYSRFDSNRDGDVTISDFIDIPLHYGKQIFKSGTAVVSTAMKSPQLRRFVDGIKSKQGSKK